MQTLENVSLKDYSTMRLGGNARYLCTATTKQQLIEAIEWAKLQQIPVITIGEGSNIVWQDAGFLGLVIVNRIPGIQQSGELDIGTYLTVGAGVNWDEFVAHTVSLGLSGIEFLSLIPGTVGATPVQNVGAYGAEVSQTITTIEAYDARLGKLVNIPASECQFGYRTSRFKTTDKGRFFITAVTFFLEKADPMPPFYGALQHYLEAHDIKSVTPSVIRDAVIAIRSSKLPDPRQVANNGSFFANPIISTADFVDFSSKHIDAPHWTTENGVKLSAAWLIEQAGFKDYHDADTGIATWHAQPLVLVNEHATSTTQLLQFRQKIIDTVQQKFNITLEQEPELI